MQFQETDLEIEVYEKAVVVFCLAGCTTDCRTSHYENGEPLRRAAERRYLQLANDRLICFDVNALPDAVAGLGIEITNSH